MTEKKKRRPRSDKTVKSIEKELGVKGALRNKDGRNTRDDKQLGTIRKETKKDKKKTK